MTPSSMGTFRTIFSPKIAAERQLPPLRTSQPKRTRTEEVADLNTLGVLGDDDVDGEMGVYKTHLVREAVTDTLDHVLDGRADRAEAGDVLASSVPDDEVDLRHLLGGGGRRNDNAHRHVDVLNVLCGATGVRAAGRGWGAGLVGARRESQAGGSGENRDVEGR